MDLDGLRSRYRGETASTYEQEREKTVKWHREQAAVANYIEHVASEDTDPRVLDIPVGTGRFFDLYDKHSLDVVGVDISEDMLKEAQKSIPQQNESISLQQGDVMNLTDLDIDSDVVVCMRFMNWLDTEDFKHAFASITETSPEYIIVGIRVRNSVRHRIAGLVRDGYHWITRSGDSKTVIHDETTVLESFSTCGFTIESRVSVDRWTFGDKYVYLLSSNQ